MDLSLAMLELAINSLDAGATLVKIRLKARRTATLVVADNGKGMDRATLSRACQKGFSTKGSGGAGLYMTKRQAESSGGSLKIRSKEGRGTRVVLKARDAVAGDIASSLAPLMDDGADIVLDATVGKKRVELDTRRLKEAFGGESLSDPIIVTAIKKYVNENLK